MQNQRLTKPFNKPTKKMIKLISEATKKMKAGHKFTPEETAEFYDSIMSLCDEKTQEKLRERFKVELGKVVQEPEVEVVEMDEVTKVEVIEDGS
jgi:hypothetical protein